MLAVLARVLIASVVASAASAATLEERLAPCLACHGENGRSETPEVPSLGGQPPMFMLIELYQFRGGQRPGTVMTEFAKDLTDDDLRTFSDALAALPPPQPPGPPEDTARYGRGEALAAQHRCGSCHNPDFSGREQIPRLAAQREDYLLKALRDYKSGARPGYDPAMAQVLYPLDDSALVDLAHFLAHVAPRAAP